MKPIPKTGRAWNTDAPRQIAPGAGALRGPMSRKCPRCEAQPGYSCTKVTGSFKSGTYAGPGYTVRLAQPHMERKRRPGGAA